MYEWEGEEGRWNEKEEGRLKEEVSHREDQRVNGNIYMLDRSGGRGEIRV